MSSSVEIMMLLTMEKHQCELCGSLFNRWGGSVLHCW
jgi:hypothetical protein